MPSKETVSELSNRDQAYLNLAVELAKTSQCRQRHGAVVVAGGSVIATGVNKFRNHPNVLSEYDVLLGASHHAEMDAIKQLQYRVLHNAVIYVARVNKRGIERYSRPCNRCYPMLISHGIKEVVYTIDSVVRNMR